MPQRTVLSWFPFAAVIFPVAGATFRQQDFRPGL
jgi:hypothetical protein